LQRSLSLRQATPAAVRQHREQCSRHFVALVDAGGGEWDRHSRVLLDGGSVARKVPRAIGVRSVVVCLRLSAVAHAALLGVLALAVQGLGGAVAGGFSNPYQSTTAIGTAFAGASVRSDDASFFYYNPATISGLNGAQTTIDARAFAAWCERDRRWRQRQHGGKCIGWWLHDNLADR
jgi:hypothetical protein